MTYLQRFELDCLKSFLRRFAAAEDVHMPSGEDPAVLSDLIRDQADVVYDLWRQYGGDLEEALDHQFATLARVLGPNHRLMHSTAYPGAE